MILRGKQENIFKNMKGKIKMRKNELYYELLEKIFAEGKKKMFCEIAKEAISQLGEEYEEKKLRNVIYRMKNKGELGKTKDGRYYKSIREDAKEVQKVSKYDLSNFIQIKASSRKGTEEILGIWKNGELTVNAKLLQHFSEYKMNIQISRDCSEILLFSTGEEMIYVGKNGRIKNYDLQKKLKAQKKNLPAYYVGKWDEEEGLWHGTYLPYNPNRGEKQSKK